VLAIRGPDAPWLASFVSQPTNEVLYAKVGDGMRDKTAYREGVEASTSPLKE
jgi:hypothetical protein